jgi:hypothetical protein
MTLLKPISTPGRADQLQVRPRLGLFADFRRGASEAISGQELSCTRASTQPVVSQTGVSYIVGDDQPQLSFSPGGIGLTGLGDLSFPISSQIRLTQLPLIPYQIAWHGLLPIGDVGNAVWHIGDSSANNRLTLYIVAGGVRAEYVNSSGVSSSAEITGIAAQQEIFAVVQMVPAGSSNVQIRLAIKKQVAFQDLGWEVSSLGTSVACGLAYSDGLITLHREPASAGNAADCVTYRIMIQNGTADEDDLPWNWAAREADLPVSYGIVENGFVSFDPNLPSTLFLEDDASYIFVSTSSPTDYLVLAPGGTASPYIYLEKT